MHDPFRHWMPRRKPLSSTLFSIAAPQLIFLSLMSWSIVLNRANGFCLREIQVTSFPLSQQSRKKGSLYSHLWSRWNAGNTHDVGRNARNTHDVGLHLDGLHRGSNVLQKSIHPVGRTHETLHRRTLFLDKYEDTLARPIHTHNKDPPFGSVSSVSVLSWNHWSPVLLLMYGSPLAEPALVWCPSQVMGRQHFCFFSPFPFLFFLRFCQGRTVEERGERGTKRVKIFFFKIFHRTWGMRGELTAQPYVRFAWGPVRHPWKTKN
jgi:hypothetical protein